MGRHDLKMRVRFKLGDIVLVGPGKADLLAAVDRTGSISAAARDMGMSYRRAWLLIDEMNRHLDQPVVDASFGGKAGGGTQLTEFGREVLSRYRRIEATILTTVAADLDWLNGHAVAAETTE